MSGPSLEAALLAALGTALDRLNERSGWSLYERHDELAPPDPSHPRMGRWRAEIVAALLPVVQSRGEAVTVTAEQVAELATTLRAVPWVPMPPAEAALCREGFEAGVSPIKPDYDAIARVALEHCAAQPATGGLSDHSLAEDLRATKAEHVGDELTQEGAWLAVARRARELAPRLVEPPHELAMPSEREGELAAASEIHRRLFRSTADACARLRAELIDANRRTGHAIAEGLAVERDLRGRLAAVIEAASSPGDGG